MTNKPMFWSKDIPFTPWWLEVDIDANSIVVQIRELYTPDDEAQKILGSSDSRPVIGFDIFWSNR